jgi:hypothetical protein
MLSGDYFKLLSNTFRLELRAEAIGKPIKNSWETLSVTGLTPSVT